MNIASPKNISNKNVLFSPLNWGMGHVSRSIGLLHTLLNKNNKIFVACDLQQRKVYEEYFSDIHFINHKGYPFVFNGKGNFSLDLLLRSNLLFNRLKNEKKEVENYVKEFKIDIVLSDHRYGFKHDVVPSMFITHQLNLPLKWYQKSVQYLHHKLINNFDSIWVMDDENNSFAGELSKIINFSNAIYIGPFSRFMMYDIPKQKNDETVYIASGPLVYAQEFVDLYLPKKQLSNVILIAPDEVVSNHKNELQNWREKDEIILSANKIVSRSGYSTILDVFFLKCKAEYYPTKGQMEQEYLAELNKLNT